MLAIVLQKTVIEVWMLPIDKNESYVRLCQLEPANKVHINVMSWYLLGLVCGYSNGQIGLIHLRESVSCLVLVSIDMGVPVNIYHAV